MWYYLFSTDYDMVVLDYFVATEHKEFKRAEAFLETNMLPVEAYDVLGPFNSRKEAMEDALAWGKNNHTN